jgi:cobalt-zinc-cadmium efflux system outer membrane protein
MIMPITKSSQTVLFLCIILFLSSFFFNSEVRAQSLEILIQEALENNPKLKASEKKWEAAKAKIPQAGAWMDPQLSFGIMNATTDFDFAAEPMTQRQVGIMQQIPFPGKLGLKKKIAGYEALMAQKEYENLKNLIVSQVKKNYYDLFYTQRAIQITQQNKDLLSDLAKIAETKYTVGKGLQQDVLKAFVELSKFGEKIINLERREKKLQADLKILLSRPEGSSPTTPQEVTKTEYQLDLENLKKKALEKNPKLRAEELAVDRSKASYRFAKREYFPNFGLGFTYGERERWKDFLSFRITMNLPIYFFSKQNKKVEQTAKMMDFASQSYLDQQNEILYGLEDVISEIERNSDLLELFQTGILPQAEQALRSAETAYQVDKIDFLTLLNNQMTLYNYQVEYYRVLTDFQKSLADLEVILGERIF